MNSVIPPKAIELILSAEGVDQPSRWPGGASGITIGYGYDLGYEANFANDWFGVLDLDDRERLRSARGLKGRDARVIAHRFADIHITSAMALSVFTAHTLPQEIKATAAAFPGLEALPPLAQGALVSLVFNRGGSMRDDPARPKEQTRREMREIQRLVALRASRHPYAGHAEDCLDQIAQQFRDMKRLWVGKGLDGLIRRREAEAQLIEEATAA